MGNYLGLFEWPKRIIRVLIRKRGRRVNQNQIRRYEDKKTGEIDR